jgi:hypothetical protein
LGLFSNFSRLFHFKKKKKRELRFLRRFRLWGKAVVSLVEIQKYRELFWCWAALRSLKYQAVSPNVGLWRHEPAFRPRFIAILFCWGGTRKVVFAPFLDDRK